ncbi:MAG: ABC transporter permease [Candidatus Dormibacteraeota bacterium]|nr:ABC transporter permease [Candidatus Dormibacteraeota bacterium]
MDQARAVRGRVAPIGVIGGSSRVVEHNFYVYRRLWPVFLTGIFEPIFYLLGIGFGIGGLVGSITVGGQHFSYQVYVAPALMASAAMNGAIFDATFGLFYQLKYAKTYEAMLATPVTVGSVSLGAVAWAVLRGGVYSAAFLVVMAVLGLVHSLLGILMLPAAILTGFTFASLGTAAATFVRNWDDFDLMNLVLLPLFLFSATFFPITVYPPALRVVVELSPLYRAIDLMRDLGLGQLSWSMIPDVAYLLALSGLGLWITSRRMTRRLRP